MGGSPERWSQVDLGVELSWRDEITQEREGKKREVGSKCWRNVFI
jgi:hypothetical protein